MFIYAQAHATHNVNHITYNYLHVKIFSLREKGESELTVFNFILNFSFHSMKESERKITTPLLNVFMIFYLQKMLAT